MPVSTEANTEATQVASDSQEGRNSTSKRYPWMVDGCDLSEDCSMNKIRDSRGCGKTYFYDANRNETEWVLMRSAYMAIVGREASSIELEYGSGIEVPFKITKHKQYNLEGNVRVLSKMGQWHPEPCIL